MVRAYIFAPKDFQFLLGCFFLSPSFMVFSGLNLSIPSRMLQLMMNQKVI